MARKPPPIEIGDKFGRWEVIDYGPVKNRKRHWLCQCVCGKVRSVRQDGLSSGCSTGCGTRTCIYEQVSVGDKFGRWEVVYQNPTAKRSNGKPLHSWHCKCDCGVERDVDEVSLTRGRSVSCGCYVVDTMREAVETRKGFRRRTHGCTDTPEFHVWTSMKQRCNNPNCDAWHNYGGRGITYCDRWETFENFLADMGEKPDGMSIDRIDNNGNYCKDNCRWATPKEQAANRRCSKPNLRRIFAELAAILGELQSAMGV